MYHPRPAVQAAVLEAVRRQRGSGEAVMRLWAAAAVRRGMRAAAAARSGLLAAVFDVPGLVEVGGGCWCFVLCGGGG